MLCTYQEAGGAKEACGLARCGQGYRRPDGGEPAGQPRCTGSRTAARGAVLVSTPAWASASA